MLLSLASPIIFAHRGASSHAPENTLAAFHLAIDHGAKAIELDVQLTRDQEVVVFHDTKLNRTTDGSGRIRSHSLHEIKQYNAGISFSPAYQNEKVPSLAEVLDLMPPEILINIELKNLHAPLDDLPARTAAVIADFNAQDRVLISSFNVIALRNFARADASIPLGLLLPSSFSAKFYSHLLAFLINIRTIHLSYKSLSPQLVARFKQAGKLVFSYTLNHTQDILTALEMGIDGFFTDDPGFAYRLLTQKGYLTA